MFAGVLIVLAGFGGAALGWFLCTRYQMVALDAAVNVTNIGTAASDRILKAAQEQAVLAASIVTLTEHVKKLEDVAGELANRVDSLDVNQSTMLNMFINSGIARSANAATRQEQYGERPVTTAPPFDPGPGPNAPAEEVVT